MEIIFLDSDVRDFVLALDLEPHARIHKAIRILERIGAGIRPPHSKKITGRLFELRATGKIAIRLFYAFRGGKAYILH